MISRAFLTGFSSLRAAGSVSGVGLAFLGCFLPIWQGTNFARLGSPHILLHEKTLGMFFQPRPLHCIEFSLPTRVGVCHERSHRSNNNYFQEQSCWGRGAFHERWSRWSWLVELYLRYLTSSRWRFPFGPDFGVFRVENHVWGAQEFEGWNPPRRGKVYGFESSPFFFSVLPNFLALTSLHFVRWTHFFHTSILANLAHQSRVRFFGISISGGNFCKLCTHHFGHSIVFFLLSHFTDKPLYAYCSQLFHLCIYIRWNRPVQLLRRWMRRQGANEVHTICWRVVGPFSATACEVLSQMPVELRAHALAVVAGHVISQCVYNGKTRRNTEEACWFEIWWPRCEP